MRPRLAALFLLALATLVTATVLQRAGFPERLARRALGPPSAQPPQTQEPGVWFVVDPAADARLAGLIICQIGCGDGRPTLLERRELQLPQAHPLRRVPYVFIVETIVAPTGKVARARVLKGPDAASTREALRESLTGWRFTPPTQHGQPVGLTYVVTMSSRTRS
jgi:hypothetical protein